MVNREKAYALRATQGSDAQPLTKENLISILEASFDGIYITDGQANTVLINRSYETISGLSREQLMGSNMRDLVGTHVVSCSGTLAAIAQGDCVTFEQEFETGKRALITSTPLFDSYGDIEMVITNVRDITELRMLGKQLEETVRENQRHVQELEYLSWQVDAEMHLIAKTPIMQEALRQCSQVATMDVGVVLLGEMGTGKRALAQQIVNQSTRRDAPYFIINCASSYEVLEQKLFMSPQGEMGLLALADGGTVLLDEVGLLPPTLQQRLAQFLSTRRLECLDGTVLYPDLRVIVSSSVDLQMQAKEKAFSRNLLYLLDVVSIQVPPLRERRGDILAIADGFIPLFNQKYRQEKVLSKEARKAMVDYSWPGNLRELRNLLERVVIMSPGAEITEADLPFYTPETQLQSFAQEGVASIDLQQKVNALELHYITQAYRQYGNVRDAAASLHMTPSTFVRKRKALEKI